MGKGNSRCSRKMRQRKARARLKKRLANNRAAKAEAKKG